MAKPRLIILIRHAQSEGNKNREIHQTIPDHRVKLTQDGWQQAYDAGRRLRKMLRADDTLHFFTSPYRRTRETTEGILATLTSDEAEPSPFKRNNIKVYEEPRLREQDFGNFQPCSAEMERMWQERADYGHFFYRIPNGESAADAYDRISGFNESLWRQFGEDDFASVCVLVTHGLMSRVFLMKWYHFSVEYFEDLRNINHCELLIMNKQDSGKYVLENNLRTWSELRKERALKKGKEKEKEKSDTGTPGSKDTSKLDKALSADSPVKPPRRWGGCPNGCSHDKSFRLRSALAELVHRDGTSVHPNLSAAPSPVTTTVSASSSLAALGFATPPTTNGTSTPSSNLGTRRPAARRFQSEDDSSSSDVEGERNRTPQIDVAKAREETVSSPDGTPSFISVDDRLRAQDMKSPPANGKTPLAILPLLSARGRDFGGTHSGQSSDVDSSEDDRARQRKQSSLGLKVVTSRVAEMSLNADGDSAPGSGKRDQSGMGRGTMANRLGDSPVSSSSGCCEEHHHQLGEHNNENEHADDEREKGNGDEDDADEISDAEIDTAEREDRSIKGSVY
ncbi:hypothetical protein INS49_011353 [Diaporthe citri]|uniref:uncharacterized protein n=1 Tax=Diaporthe citri TaxID=83186 RepID=UPI001C81CABF|nr:uncharacterized protein INS49_011353 [Diaporthe citri]KAG6360296.1 hypothetical protein INS49_011353 [Diaporthe citri]